MQPGEHVRAIADTMTRGEPPIIASPSPEDRHVDSTDETIEGQTEGLTAVSGAPDDQKLADRDQSLADADQTGSNSDQAAAGREQAAADSDQAASDRDLAQGGDPEVHDSSRDARDHSAQQRQYSAQGRVDTADSRDHIAHARDLTASARDQAAARRDRELTTREGSTGKHSEIMLRAAEDRRSAAADRAAAAEGRARAAADRAQAARDRELATLAARQARADRDRLVRQLAIAETDGLTGTRARATGLQHIASEIDRARRTMAPLVVAYIDVVGLKVVNDSLGHAAGDALLQRAVDGIRRHLRSYDLIVRIGGDEFLCVMSGASIHDAEHRFSVIQAALAADAEPCAIKVGFAELEAEDSAAELIRRADAQLPLSARR
jgi:diguanylate cyclase (GGDEF)-like protein